ncbi:MAG: hypothetical protein U0992_09925 [Planctomycetaceae bacterium]
MATADKSLSLAETPRLARGMGMIGNAAADAELDKWIASLEHAGEPAAAQPNDKPQAGEADPQAEARRQLITALRRELVTLPRTEIVRRLLTQAGLTSRSTGRHRSRSNGDRSPPAARQLPLTALMLSENPGDIAEREGSDLTQPLTAAGGETPIAAVVLLTDGRDSVHRNPAPVVAAAKGAAFSVFRVLA